MRAAVAAAVGYCVLAASGCSEARAPVRSCGDDLGGVWSDGERRWHALDMRRSVELYPMYDSAETPEQSAHALIFVRGPEQIRGHHLLWETGLDRTRRVRHAATLECSAGQLEIAYEDTRLTLKRP